MTVCPCFVCLYSSFLLVRTVSPPQFTFACLSSLKTSSLLWSRVTMRSGGTAVSNRRRSAVVIHALVAPGGRISPDRFDSCSVDDLLQRQLYLRDELVRVWLLCARLWHRQRRVKPLAALSMQSGMALVGPGAIACCARRYLLFVW
jgi:hypothetical protein